VSEDLKRPFLQRWSRLKEEENKKKDLPAAQEKPPPPLPALDQLTPESDFTGFMHPKVEDALRRAALKKLFADPHFNLPDPYEAYSGDWTVGEPISDELMATLNQARTHLFGDKKEEEKETPAVEAPLARDENPPPPDEPGKQDA
jgi:hypothetical protein